MESGFFVYACLLACLYSIVNMFALSQPQVVQMNLALLLLTRGKLIHKSNTYCIHTHTRTTIIINIINCHRSKLVSKDSHLPINYSRKLLPPRSLINSCAVTQKEMSSDKWAQDLKAARSAKHFPLQFISNFTVNHQPELATLGNRTTWLVE